MSSSQNKTPTGKIVFVKSKNNNNNLDYTVDAINIVSTRAK